MPRHTSSVAAPLVDELHLHDLTEADPATIRAHGHHEGRRFVDADLADRDLSGVSFTECELLGLEVDGAELRAARFVETRIERIQAPALSAGRSSWRDVWIESSRVGAAELYDAELQSVVISSSKLTYVNLRSATLRDVLFSGCTFDELDLTHVRAERVAFQNCTVRALQLDHAELTDVDLRGLDIVGTISGIDGMRGAVIGPAQAVTLSDAFTQHLGIRVLDR